MATHSEEGNVEDDKVLSHREKDGTISHTLREGGITSRLWFSLKLGGGGVERGGGGVITATTRIYPGIHSGKSVPFFLPEV